MNTKIVSSVWSHQSLFQRYSSINSLYEKPIFNPRPLGDLDKGHVFPLEIDKFILSRISSLFLTCSPSAIFLAVVPIVIDAINLGVFKTVPSLMFKKTIKHVILELLKRAPEKLYSSTPIVFVRRIIWIYASLLNRLETMIEFQFDRLISKVLTNRKSMSLLYAPTRNLFRVSKTVTRYDFGITAIALAQKFVIARSILTHFFKNLKLTKMMPHKVYFSHDVYTSILTTKLQSI